MSTQAASGEDLIAITKEYFKRVDSGAPDLLDLFTDDAQIFFPRFGYAHGKAEMVPFLVGLTTAVASFDHPEDRMVFTHGGNRVVVEGAENGVLASGVSFPGDARSAGLFCNVFEFEDHLISRLHVYADPDLAGVQPELFPWGGREATMRNDPTSIPASSSQMQDWKSVEAIGSVESTVLLLQDLLISKGIASLGKFDHGSNARKSGLTLDDEVVVVFGSPDVGTKLMQDNPDVGYDLPLRILVRDDRGVTSVSYRDPKTFINTYGLTTSRPEVEKMSELLRDLLGRVAKE
ncbi:hypothetical protein B7R22_18380 [Subtercola boreus]|uniref:Uncharacterized protein n=1 Tax=Subtercola boreus TaxID=120213 RepID=A0A3E0VQN0_9MICO|nr:DUF302 domain-containing protein [Subtercola boreus]RFA11683.1 hypothetical protein B7R22_18380 [Subtercola boreus]